MNNTNKLRLFDARLCEREFGAQIIGVSALLQWAEGKGYQIHTSPALDEYQAAQIEALLCAIERAAPLGDDAARAIIEHSALATHKAADIAAGWLHGAERARIWRQRIRDALAAGELRLLDPFTFDEQVSPIATRAQTADDAPTDWMTQARTIADELDAKDRKAQCHDSRKNMAERVATIMRDAGTHGPRGPLSGSTILREALGGSRWKRKER